MGKRDRALSILCRLHCNLHVFGRSISFRHEKLRRSFLLLFSFSSVSPFFPTFPSSAKSKSKNPYDERRLLEQNKRVQRENNAPDDFPSFVREGFEVKVVTLENYVKTNSGLIYRDYEVGNGDCPKAGQQVTFHYVGYNESGRRIDSTYLQGTPAKIRMGTNALVPREMTRTFTSRVPSLWDIPSKKFKHHSQLVQDLRKE